MSQLKGGGGKKQTAATPTNTPDNLRSEDMVEVILGVTEGPWKGLTNGNKSFNVGDTVLQRQDGEYNFEDFDVKVYPGTAFPDPLVYKLGGESSNFQVGVSTVYGTPITRQTEHGNIDAIDIRLVVNQLYESRESGKSPGVFDTTFEFRVKYKPLSATDWSYWDAAAAQIVGTGNPYVTPRQTWSPQTVRSGNMFTDVFTNQVWNTQDFNNAATWYVNNGGSNGGSLYITGKTTSTYVKEYRIPVQRSPEPYLIQIERVSPDSSLSGDPKYYASVTWESFQTIDTGSKSYPYTGFIQVSGRSTDQFTSIPQFSGEGDGLIVKVPSNYNPETREFTGTWDGIFKEAWTNDPVWILYEAIHNDRWGWSTYTPVKWSRYAAYELSQITNFKLANGLPRYTFNAYLTEPMDGREFCRYIAGSFNAIINDDDNGNVQVLMDKDDPAVALFGPESIIGDFEYTYTDVNTRFNDITAVFRNPDVDYNEDRRGIKDQAHIDQHGRIPFDFIAVGTTNENEAVRKASRRLVSATTETEMVNFKTNRKAQYLVPYDIILITDPYKGYGLSGRFKSFSGNTITLRDPLYLESGINYAIDVQDTTGIVSCNLTVSTTGFTTTLTVSGSALPNTINQKAQFSLKQSESGYGLPKPYRILDITPNDEDDFAVMAIEVNRNKFAAEDNAELVGEPRYSFPIKKEPAPPKNLKVTNLSRAAEDGTMTYEIRYDFTPPSDPYVTAYSIRYRLDTESEFIVQSSDGTGGVLTVPRAGNYVVEVQSLNIWNQQSPWVGTNLAPLPVNKAGGVQAGGSLLSAVGGLNQVTIKVAYPTNQTDIRYVNVYESLTNSNALATFVGKTDSTTYVRTGFTGVQSRYFFIKFEDNLGNLGGFTSSNGVLATSTQATGTDLADGTITANKFVPGLSPVESVSSLPSSGNYEGRVVLLSTDGKLYNYKGGQWVKVVADVTGAGIESVSTLPTGLTAADEGRVVFLKSDDKLYRWTGTTWIANFNAADISGQIIGAQIEAAAIDRTKFAVGLTGVEVGSTLPAQPATVGRQFFKTGENKLYRSDGNQWLSSTAAGDIAGELALTNIPILNTGKIADGAIGATKLASSIAAVEIFASLPSTGNFQGRQVFNTADGKTYRYTAALGWTASTAAVDISGILPVDKVPVLDASKLANGILDATKFANSIRPVEIVNGFPSTGNTQGRTIFNTYDNKQYRWLSPTVTTGVDYWSAASQAIDIIGELALGNIPVMSAAKIGNGILDATKFASSIRPVEIVNGFPSTGNTQGRTIFNTYDNKQYRWLSASVSTGTEYWSATSAASDITGELASNQITTGAITTTKISDNAITTPKMVVGSINADRLIAQSITAGLIAANTITAAQIAADTITAGQIAAGAITASEIAAGAITASKLAIGNFNNIIPDGDFRDVNWWTGNDIVDPMEAGGAQLIDLSDGNWLMQRGLLFPGAAGQGYDVRSQYFSAEPGAVYKITFRVWRNDPGTNGWFMPMIHVPGSMWMNLKHSVTTGVPQGFDPNDTNPAYRYEGQLDTVDKTFIWQAPANVYNAYYGKIQFRFMGTQTVGNTIFQVKMVRVSDATLIQDGSITTDKMTVNSINANRLVSGSITATQIAGDTITGDRIKGNTITAANIAADTITAGNIAASAIGVAELAAGAVTASKMAIGSFDNLLPNAELRSGNLDGWTRLAMAGASQITVPSNSAWPSQYGLLLARGAGDTTELSAIAQIGGDAFDMNNGIPAAPGDEFYIDAATYQTVLGAVGWDALLRRTDGTLVNIDAYGLTNTSGGTSLLISTGAINQFVKITGYFKNNTASNGKLYIRFWNLSTTSGALAYYWSTILRRRNTGQLLVDGTVTANQIAGNTITGDKIVGNTITGSHIQGDTITGGHIKGATITGGNIVANTITSNHIAVDTITAGNIAAGAIGASEIAAGAITANKLLVVPTNMNPDPYFKDFAAGGGFWTVYPGWYYEARNTTNLLNTVGLPGGMVLWADSPNIIGTIHDTRYVHTNNAYANTGVVVGATYRIKARVYNGLNAKLYVLAEFFNSIGGSLGNGTAVGWANAYAGAYEVDFQTKAPEGADTYRLMVYNETVATLTGVAVVSGLEMALAASATMIVDGAIVADKLAVNAVTANKILAGTITGDRIAANTISAGNLVANTITAGQIAAGAIGADQIAANAITAKHLLIGNVDNIIPDNAYRDQTFWGNGASGVSLVDVDGNWTTSRAVVFQPNGSLDMYSRFFTVEPGAQYKITFRVYTGDMTPGGWFQPLIHVPSYQWQSLRLSSVANPPQNIGTLNVGSANASDGGYPNGFDTGDASYIYYSPTGVSGNQNRQIQFRFMGNFAGAVYMQVKIVRVSDTTLISDGAITTNKIVANAITAGKIAADAVTANSILAGSITGNKIAATTISGTNIIGGSITGDNIAANTITAGKMSVSSLSALSGNIGEVTSGLLRSASYETVLDLNSQRLTFAKAGYSFRQGTGLGSDVLVWYGYNSVGFGAETRTNGVWAFGTDGKVYYGTAELGGTSNQVKLTATSEYTSLTVSTAGTYTTPNVTITASGGSGNYSYVFAMLGSQSSTRTTNNFRQNGGQLNATQGQASFTGTVVVGESISGSMMCLVKDNSTGLTANIIIAGDITHNA